MPLSRAPGTAKRECTYYLFRNKQRPHLICAAAINRSLPGFLLSEEWLFEGSLGVSDAAPPGFREGPAATGIRLNGFYLFHCLSTERKLGRNLDTVRNRVA